MHPSTYSLLTAMLVSFILKENAFEKYMEVARQPGHCLGHIEALGRFVTS